MVTDLELEEYKNSFITNLNVCLDKNPTERELWIVKQFLLIHGISFEPSELSKASDESKIDVNYKDSAFQVKRIIYPEGFKPTKEDNDLKLKIIESNTFQELNTACIYGPFDNSEWHQPDVLQHVLIDRANFWSKKKDKKKKELLYPPSIRSKLDLLFYVEADLKKKRLTGFDFDLLISHQLNNLGWRSISYVYGSQSLILYIAKNTPNYMKDIYFSQISALK